MSRQFINNQPVLFAYTTSAQTTVQFPAQKLVKKDYRVCNKDKLQEKKENVKEIKNGKR